MPVRNTESAFWKKAKKGAAPECWPWAGSVNWAGYGTFKFRGERGAHRASWVIHFGEIPEGQHVLHRCDNPACVNPHHLFLGTHAENMRDMGIKGRARPPAPARGPTHHCARLDERKVKAIRERYALGGVRQADLANEFGVSQPVISAVILRKTWKHI